MGNFCIVAVYECFEDNLWEQNYHQGFICIEWYLPNDSDRK